MTVTKPTTRETTWEPEPSGRRGRHIGGEVQPDRGCRFAPRCTDCPWTRCLLTDAGETERRELAAALRVVRQWVRVPDGTIAVD